MLPTADCMGVAATDVDDVLPREIVGRCCDDDDDVKAWLPPREEASDRVTMIVLRKGAIVYYCSTVIDLLE